VVVAVLARKKLAGQSWFGVLVVFEHKNADGSRRGYEEAVYLIKASDSDCAIQMAVTTAGENAVAIKGKTYCGYAVAYTCDRGAAQSGMEAFCSIELSSEEPTDYIKRRYRCRLGESWEKA
jgi:hypothetical protein